MQAFHTASIRLGSGVQHIIQLYDWGEAGYTYLEEYNALTATIHISYFGWDPWGKQLQFGGLHVSHRSQVRTVLFGLESDTSLGAEIVNFELCVWSILEVKQPTTRYPGFGQSITLMDGRED